LSLGAGVDLPGDPRVSLEKLGTHGYDHVGPRPQDRVGSRKLAAPFAEVELRGLGLRREQADPNVLELRALAASVAAGEQPPHNRADLIAVRSAPAAVDMHRHALPLEFAQSPLGDAENFGQFALGDGIQRR
jgi:hypothetical protein